MVSIPDSELRAYIQQHIPVCDKHDYKKLAGGRILRRRVSCMA